MKRAVILCVTVFLALGLVEGALRREDIVEPPPQVIDSKVKAYADSLTQQPLPTTWFEENPVSPAPSVSPQNQDLFRRFAHAPGSPETMLVWNKAYLASPDFCRERKNLWTHASEVMTFTPPDATPYPRYRYLPNVPLHRRCSYVTNALGWRGHEIDERKKKNVIRIVFVGAATTRGRENAPYTYPEFVEHWLNRFAQSQNWTVRFEVGNAGRPEFISTDIAAVVRQEVLPLAPDLVVYYEGSTQFWPGAYPQEEFEFSQRYRYQRLASRRRDSGDYSKIIERLQIWFDYLHDGNQGREPPKPQQIIRWPKNLWENDPDLARPDLPLKLTAILKDLGETEAVLRKHNAALVLSSYYWLPWEGMQVTLPRNARLYGMLNGNYWPIRYSVIRRYADFQNRALRKFAKVNHLAWIDIAGKIPRDPDLMTDALQFSDDGIRLQAWAAFMELLPLIRDGVTSGRLPVKPEHPSRLPPSIRNFPIEIVALDPINERCEGAP